MYLLFILFSQLLALSTSIILWWFIQPKRLSAKVSLVIIVFLINNVALVYGLSEFWRERFHVYLVISILQGFLVYAALLTAICAVIYLQLFKQPRRPKLTRLIAVSAYVGIVGLALFNAYSPVVHRLTVETDKPLAKPIKIALVSDTHLGRWFGNRQLHKLVNLVDAQQPDMVLLAGDVMNDSTFYYDKNNMQQQLSKLQAPLGVYAVLGNHDYSGNQLAIAKAVTDAGIKVIDNKTLLIDEAIWLVGRSDETDPMRPAASDLLSAVDSSKPVLFLEHSPSVVLEVSPLPIDLHLSGHTHGGQIFPLTTLLQWFRPLIYGPKKIDDTQFLVTSGYGFGAVPFRLGTRAEIWLITLQARDVKPSAN